MYISLKRVVRGGHMGTRMIKMYECLKSHASSVCVKLSCAIIFCAASLQDGVELWHLKVFYPSWINRDQHSLTHTHTVSHPGWLWHRQTHTLTHTSHQTSPNMHIPHTQMGSPAFSSALCPHGRGLVLHQWNDPLLLYTLCFAEKCWHHAVKLFWWMFFCLDKFTRQAQNFPPNAHQLIQMFFFCPVKVISNCDSQSKCSLIATFFSAQFLTELSFYLSLLQEMSPSGRQFSLATKIPFVDISWAVTTEVTFSCTCVEPSVCVCSLLMLKKQQVLNNLAEPRLHGSLSHEEILCVSAVFFFQPGSKLLRNAEVFNWMCKGFMCVWSLLL